MLTEDQVKDLASYIQFKAERIFDEYASLDNSTVVEFLSLCGATIIAKNQLIEHVWLILMPMMSVKIVFAEVIGSQKTLIVLMNNMTILQPLF